MTCVHLRKLYELCQQSEIRITSLDMVHVVCHQCGQKEVCPSMLMDEYAWEVEDTTNPHATANHPPVPPPT
ncbi:MAG TPA: hypothetical protein VL096_07010 [Pirellulaceae bacterium]|nr:hypothetical protein [Pirellulaceae bacterium]